MAAFVSASCALPCAASTDGPRRLTSCAGAPGARTAFSGNDTCDGSTGAPSGGVIGPGAETGTAPGPGPGGGPGGGAGGVGGVVVNGVFASALLSMVPDGV